MGAIFFVVLLLETFVCGHLLSRCRDLKEENDLLRESLPYFHTNDWADVKEIAKDE